MPRSDCSIQLHADFQLCGAPLIPHIIKGSATYPKVELQFIVFPDLKVKLNYFAKGLDSVIVLPTNV